MMLRMADTHIVYWDGPSETLTWNGAELEQPDSDADGPVQLAWIDVADVTDGEVEVTGHGELLVTIGGKTYNTLLATARGADLGATFILVGVPTASSGPEAPEK